MRRVEARFNWLFVLQLHTNFVHLNATTQHTHAFKKKVEDDIQNDARLINLHRTRNDDLTKAGKTARGSLPDKRNFAVGLAKAIAQRVIDRELERLLGNDADRLNWQAAIRRAAARPVFRGAASVLVLCFSRLFAQINSNSLLTECLRSESSSQCSQRCLATQTDKTVTFDTRRKASSRFTVVRTAFERRRNAGRHFDLTRRASGTQARRARSPYAKRQKKLK